tara:strand:- start:1 stop:234 length:234 start_codon:yes stop_codon:yes gene_type:complete
MIPWLLAFPEKQDDPTITSEVLIVSVDTHSLTSRHTLYLSHDIRKMADFTLIFVYVLTMTFLAVLGQNEKDQKSINY